MSRTVTATYRLQLRREFPLGAARELVPYFASLGVSHLYLSPVLAAVPGSAHGYDVVDPARVNPELGTEDDLRGLAADLHAREMGILLDIVPNHMSAGEHNRYWDHVLERGPESRFASWFDVDWDAPRARRRVILPVLGDELDAVLERGELKLHIRDSGSRLAYFGRTFPLDPATLPLEVQLAQLDPAGAPAAAEWSAGAEGRRRMRALLDAQHYRLVFWRRVADINYRRFFDINDLVALRQEDESVFDATHELVFSWVRDGILDGLRIDHVDGLRDPAAYLGRLRARVDASRNPGAPDPFPIVVEKILTGDERLPEAWPVQGTTGYDFMNEVEDLFLDAKGLADIEAMYRALRHNPELRFRAIAREGKRRALTGPLWADVMRAARFARAWRKPQAPSLQEIADAIVEFIVHLDAYRTYVAEPGIVTSEDRALVRGALAGARAALRSQGGALALIEEAFLAPPSNESPRHELVMRIQQTSGPAAAKGVEDTALYVYLPLASRNEVGGEPDRPLPGAHRRLHERNEARARVWPGTMLATDTHDTKRSADLRSRLDLLTVMPQEWARYVARWRRLNKPLRAVVRGRLTPDTNSEYLYYQTVFGLWPAQRPERRADDLPGREWLEAARERLVGYMRKAAREAKVRTSWTETDHEYEQALLGFVRETLTPGEERHFLPDMARLTALTAEAGFRAALARVLLQFTTPGTPDIYQGSEVWSFTLVDPDNRRPVEYDTRRRLLEQIQSAGGPALARGRLFEPATKLALVARLLRVRRERPRLFVAGDYTPLQIVDAQDAVFAFARSGADGRCIVVARTRFTDQPLTASGAIVLPSRMDGVWTSPLTGRDVELVREGHRMAVPLDSFLQAEQPCELLVQ